MARLPICLLDFPCRIAKTDIMPAFPDPIRRRGRM
jgi:hypothetical protein